MQDSKLLKLLGTLNPTELRKFGKFVRSPYYNCNQHVLDFYAYLKRYYPDFTSNNLDNAVVFKKLFPKEKFNVNKLHKLKTTLIHLVQEYLITLEMDKKEYEKKKILAKIYGERNLYDLLEKESEDLKKELEEAPYRNRTYYLEMFDLNSRLFFHPLTNKQQKGLKELEENMDYLDAFYALTKLQLSAEMRTRENILDESYSIRLLNEVKELTTAPGISRNLLFEIYQKIIDLHKNEATSEDFQLLHQRFQMVIPNISLREQQRILQHLLNHAIRMLNQGQSPYRRIAFELYLLGLQHNLIIENDRMSEITYTNIASLGTHLGEFDWTHTFIENYQEYLKVDLRDDLHALSLAFWHFHQKEFHQAIRLLNSSQFRNILNQLKAKSLLIQSYYEIFLLDESNYDFLLDQLSAFEKYIRRNETISSKKSDAYLNFIKCCRALTHATYGKDDLEAIRVKILSTKPLAYTAWLKQVSGV